MHTELVAACPQIAKSEIDAAALSLISINAVRDMVVWIAADGTIVFANDSARAHFAQCDGNLIHKKMYEIADGFNEELWKQHWQEILERKSFRFENEHHVGGGKIVPVEVSVNLVEFEGQQFNCAVFNDITQRRMLETELRRVNKELKLQSMTDALTGLPNRRAFESTLQEAYAHSPRGALSLLMLDVDHFKAYNDTYGHLAGDECLRRVGAVLRKVACGAADVVTRIGGEEFACVFSTTSREQPLQVAEAIRRGVIEENIPHRGSSTAPVVTVSIGLAIGLGAELAEQQSLLQVADQCLYAAKAAGRNQVRYKCLAPSARVA